MVAFFFKRVGPLIHDSSELAYYVLSEALTVTIPANKHYGGPLQSTPLGSNNCSNLITFTQKSNCWTIHGPIRGPLQLLTTAVSRSTLRSFVERCGPIRPAAKVKVWINWIWQSCERRCTTWDADLGMNIIFLYGVSCQALRARRQTGIRESGIEKNE